MIGSIPGIVSAAALGAVVTLSSPATAGVTEIDTNHGTFILENGFPTQATVAKLYDEMDFERAVQAYLWALPIMAMHEWQRQSRETFGAGNLNYVDYLNFKDKLGILTANATTPYTQAFPDLKEIGPLVVEIPAGPTAGGIFDFWQRPLTGTGQTGPEKGKGAKFLVLGPDHPDMKPDGYIVVRSPTWNIWSGQRALGDDVAAATKLLADFKLYPYAQRDNPPLSMHVTPEGKTWSATQPRGMDYWRGLTDVIDREPPIERDRLMLAMLVPLGIEKGKAFNPDERQTKILTEAAQVGELMARANSYAKRFPGSQVWPDRNWEFSLYLDNVTQEPPNYTQLDERGSWFYEAVGVTVDMLGKTVGLGQVYLESQKDSTGAWLDGGKTYHLNVPANAPVAQFWSFSVYDNETRALIDSGSYPDRSSRAAAGPRSRASCWCARSPTAPSTAHPTSTTRPITS